jgi:hypothetical protein
LSLSRSPKEDWDKPLSLQRNHFPFIQRRLRAEKDRDEPLSLQQWRAGRLPKEDRDEPLSLQQWQADI